MTGNETGERPDRYVMVVDRGSGTRPTGILLAAVYGEAHEEGAMVVVFDMAEADATLTGKQVGRNIADSICEQMDPGIPLSLMIGTTVGGMKPVKWVVLPAVRRRLRDIQAWAQGEGREDIARRAGEEFTHDLYCANVAGAPRDVGRKITVHQRVGELTTALELGRLRILGDVPLFEDVTNALRSFDPGERSKEGKDLWDSGSREGIITALTVVSMAHAPARVFHARTDAQGRVRMVNVVSPDSGYGTAPAAYVAGDGVFGVDGTVPGRGAFGMRADHLTGLVPGDVSSGSRLKALGRAVTSWRNGTGAVTADGGEESDALRRSVQRARDHVAAGFPLPVKTPTYAGQGEPWGAAGGVTTGLNEATAAYEERRSTGQR
ncbi:hypothetical protein ACWC0C_07055 [Streptomyces sp. NPDC001709]